MTPLIFPFEPFPPVCLSGDDAAWSAAMRVMGVESYVKDHPLERHLRDALVFPLYDGGNMGVRRRQLHRILSATDYDSMIIAEDREFPFTKEMAGSRRAMADATAP